MTEKNGIYKCSVCGNVVEMVEVHPGELVCCNKPMELQEQKGQDQEGKEKHVPVTQIDGNTVKVNVGSVDHPMEEEHFIELIELVREGEVVKAARLLPGQKPHAEFCLDNAEGLSARIYCNVHGLWG